MPYENIIKVYTIVAPLLGATQFVVFGVWLGLMLLSPATLEGLAEDQISKIRSYRHRYVRILFRSIFMFFVLSLPTAFFMWMTTQYRIPPLAFYIVLGILYAVWWVYLTGGTLYTAWQCLNELQERE